MLFNSALHLASIYACNLGKETRLRRFYLFSTSFFHLVKVHLTFFLHASAFYTLVVFNNASASR